VAAERSLICCQQDTEPAAPPPLTAFALASAPATAAAAVGEGWFVAVLAPFLLLANTVEAPPFAALLSAALVYDAGAALLNHPAGFPTPCPASLAVAVLTAAASPPALTATPRTAAALALATLPLPQRSRASSPLGASSRFLEISPLRRTPLQAGPLAVTAIASLGFAALSARVADDASQRPAPISAAEARERADDDTFREAKRRALSERKSWDARLQWRLRKRRPPGDADEGGR